MERFELTVVAQGPQSIWIALLVVALLCMSAVESLLIVCTRHQLVSRGPRATKGRNRAEVEE